MDLLALHNTIYFINYVAVRNGVLLDRRLFLSLLLRLTRLLDSLLRLVLLLVRGFPPFFFDVVGVFPRVVFQTIVRHFAFLL